MRCGGLVGVIVGGLVGAVVVSVAGLTTFAFRNLPRRCSLSCLSSRVLLVGFTCGAGSGEMGLGGFADGFVVVVVVEVVVVVAVKSGGHESVRGRASAGFVRHQLI